MSSARPSGCSPLAAWTRVRRVAVGDEDLVALAQPADVGQQPAVDQLAGKAGDVDDLAAAGGLAKPRRELGRCASSPSHSRSGPVRQAQRTRQPTEARNRRERRSSRHRAVPEGGLLARSRPVQLDVDVIAMRLGAVEIVSHVAVWPSSSCSARAPPSPPTSSCSRRSDPARPCGGQAPWCCRCGRVRSRSRSAASRRVAERRCRRRGASRSRALPNERCNSSRLSRSQRVIPQALATDIAL